MTIFQAISAAMGDIEPIAKGRRNDKQGFNFRGIDDIMSELQPVLCKHGLFVVPEALDVIREQKQSTSGGVLLYSIVKMRYTFYSTDGSFIQSVVIGEGMDSGDKASNKAMAVAMKYALLQVFCIPTEDAKDPDAESHEVQQKPSKLAIVKQSLIDWLNVTPKVFTPEQEQYANDMIAANNIAGMEKAIAKAVEKSKKERNV